MVTSGIQLYVLRNVEAPLADVLERVAEAGFESVEFAFRIYDEDEDAVRRALEETGLDVAGAHVAIDRLETDLEPTVELFRSFGATTLTVPSLDAEYFDSRAGVESAAARLLDVADDLRAVDVDLQYHNHAHEFVDVDGEYALEILFEEVGEHVRPQVDLAHAARAGADPVAVLRRLGDVPQAHVADVDREDNESVPLGDGDIDLESAASAFREVGGEYLLYEREDGDPLRSLERAAIDVRTLCGK